jgi:exodeoxyribonuclease VII large subunit
MKIGIVTSPTGAVIHDIIRVIRRRNPKLDIILWPSEVQGDIAVPQLAAGIAALNEYGQVDLIIIGRGGGSLEDLWAFNDEQVVRAVYNSVIPVISAVGHEVDYTLTDLAADYSAATPSMAAEMAAWSLGDFQTTLRDYIKEMSRAAKAMIEDGRDRFVDLISSPTLAKPESILEQRYQRLDNQLRLLHLLSTSRFDTFRKRTALACSRLEALSPLAVLARGYSVARTLPEGKVIGSIKEIEIGGRMETIVTDGSIFSKIDEIRKK